MAQVNEVAFDGLPLESATVTVDRGGADGGGGAGDLPCRGADRLVRLGKPSGRVGQGASVAVGRVDLEARRRADHRGL